MMRETNALGSRDSFLLNCGEDFESPITLRTILAFSQISLFTANAQSASYDADQEVFVRLDFLIFPLPRQ
jgi:hypothetical protein